MKKLILLSVIIAAIAIPARMSKMKDGRAGFKKTIVYTLVFNAIYVILLTQVWFRLAP